MADQPKSQSYRGRKAKQDTQRGCGREGENAVIGACYVDLRKAKPAKTSLDAGHCNGNATPGKHGAAILPRSGYKCARTAVSSWASLIFPLRRATILPFLSRIRVNGKPPS